MPIFQWLKSLPSTKLCRILGCSLSLLILSIPVIAQNTIEVRIDDGQATSTCEANPEPLWQVNIENEGWITYGSILCHTTTPNTQFTTNLDCLGDLRGGEIQVCFRVFENDNSLFDPCRIDMDCAQMVCEFFVLPLAGASADYNLSIPDGLDSGGSLSFSISVDGPQNGAVNDHICHAIDLGTLDNRAAQEKEDLTTYNNFCATATEEVDPKKVDGSFTNNAGVWFSFNTGDDPSKLILIEAFNDPESTGDIINLQLALYQLDTDCKGEINYITDHHNSGVLDEHLLLECLPPNQKYYLLVDGVFDDTNPAVPELNGYFSIRIREIEVEGGNDEICGAINLPIEEGGTITHTNFFNNCATNTNDPIVENYPSIKPVWFQFTPPSTHRAFIEVISNQAYPNGIDPIEPQIAIFSSDDDTCTGNLMRVSHHYENDELENGINVSCLDPSKPYWIMIDGSQANPTGRFDIRITDPGYPDLKPFEAVGCQGMPVVLGDQIYTEAGVYIDTVQFENCLEILETTVRFGDSLRMNLDITKLAGGLGVSDGNANLSVTGGSGVYDITWTDGTAEPVGKDLTGGTNYCISIVDSISCMLDTCFEMPYVTPIQATFRNDTLDCFGDNGSLRLSITRGLPPYNYELVNVDNGLAIKTGTISNPSATLFFTDLVAGTYQIFVTTANNVLNKMATVVSPKAIDISIEAQTLASCHNVCDAMVDLKVEGGNGDFDFNWADQVSRGQNPRALCGGNYQLTVTDKKQCTASFDLAIDQPEFFAAKATQTKAVSCFGEENGTAIVSASSNLTNFAWDNGDTTSAANSLSAGTHAVIVRNEDNCTDTAFVEIEGPAPLVATIDVLSTINCFGDNNGLLEGMATGGNGSFSYLWNNNSVATLNDNLSAGNYSLTVTDALGCININSLELSQPAALSAPITTQDVTCPGGPNSGEISIGEPRGGVAPYAHSLNGTIFSTATSFNNLGADNYEISTQDANGCTIVESTVINDPPILEVDLGEPQTLKLGNSIQLTALTNLPVTYQWNVTDDSECTDCEAIEITPTASTMYKVTVTDVNTDCVATDEVFIAIDNDRDVYVPNAFSPNGDGYNDALMIYGGNDIKSIKAFKVFDRHGTLVYQADNFAPNDASTSWKGDFNGQRLASALFIYWAEVEFIDGYSDIYKGDIALFR